MSYLQILTSWSKDLALLIKAIGVSLYSYFFFSYGTLTQENKVLKEKVKENEKDTQIENKVASMSNSSVFKLLRDKFSRNVTK